MQQIIHLKRVLFLATGSPRKILNPIQIIGKLPPERVTIDDICPPRIPCVECPDPKELKCRDSGVSLFDLIDKWEVRQLGNKTNKKKPNRSTGKHTLKKMKLYFDSDTFFYAPSKTNNSLRGITLERKNNNYFYYRP